MCNREKIEKRILRISLCSGIGFAIIEFIMAVISKSQAILMDATFDAAELFVIATSLMLTPLLYRPVTEKHPFGFSQCESLFIIVKGVLLTGVTISIISSNVQVALNGGNHIDVILVSKMEFILTALSFCVLLVLNHYGKKVNSPISNAEIYGWKLDVLCGTGIAVAFLIPNLIKNSKFSFIVPYFDQIVAIVLVTLMIPEPIKMVIDSVRSLLLFSPSSEITEKIKEVVENEFYKYNMECLFLDIVRTGRKIWIEVTYESYNSEITIKTLKKVYRNIKRNLANEFEDIDLELVPNLEDENSV